MEDAHGHLLQLVALILHCIRHVILLGLSLIAVGVSFFAVLLTLLLLLSDFDGSVASSGLTLGRNEDPRLVRLPCRHLLVLSIILVLVGLILIHHCVLIGDDSLHFAFIFIVNQRAFHWLVCVASTFLSRRLVVHRHVFVDLGLLVLVLRCRRGVNLIRVSLSLFIWLIHRIVYFDRLN